MHLHQIYCSLAMSALRRIEEVLLEVPFSQKRPSTLIANESDLLMDNSLMSKDSLLLTESQLAAITGEWPLQSTNGDVCLQRF